MFCVCVCVCVCLCVCVYARVLVCSNSWSSSAHLVSTRAILASGSSGRKHTLVLSSTAHGLGLGAVVGTCGTIEMIYPLGVIVYQELVTVPVRDTPPELRAHLTVLASSEPPPVPVTITITITITTAWVSATVVLVLLLDCTVVGAVVAVVAAVVALLRLQ